MRACTQAWGCLALDCEFDHQRTLHLRHLRPLLRSLGLSGDRAGNGRLMLLFPICERERKMNGILRSLWRVSIATGLIVIAVISSAHAERVDYEALAEKLVVRCANIQEGDLVLVNGGVRDFELLENIAVNVRKLGAFPLVTVGSDRMTKQMYDEVPPKYDSQEPMFDLHLIKTINATINVASSESIGFLEHVPAGRLAAVGEAYKPLGDIALKRNIKSVYLGNGLYPISDRAGMYEVSLEQLTKTFWDGVNVDYSLLRSRGESLKTSLQGGKEIHITNPNGTDLKVGVEGRQVYVSDGTITDEDVDTGGAACQVWLPAGEVFLTPIPGTAEGKVVVNSQFYQGKEIEGLTLNFENGKLTSMTAKAGFEPLKEIYDACGSGKDEFAAIDIGMNPNVRTIPGSKMDVWMATGMVTVGIGSNLWAGGENNSNFGLFSFLPGSTLKVDGKVLVENGELKK